jgi:hypothetical protein
VFRSDEVSPAVETFIRQIETIPERRAAGVAVGGRGVILSVTCAVALGAPGATRSGCPAHGARPMQSRPGRFRSTARSRSDHREPLAAIDCEPVGNTAAFALAEGGGVTDTRTRDERHFGRCSALSRYAAVSGPAADKPSEPPLPRVTQTHIDVLWSASTL